ncbi:hypothetical protein D3C75_1309900 [compost metagenome]
MVTRTAGEGIYHRNSKLLGQLNGINQIFMVLKREFLLRMQRIAVTAERTDDQTA